MTFDFHSHTCLHSHISCFVLISHREVIPVILLPVHGTGTTAETQRDWCCGNIINWKVSIHSYFRSPCLSLLLVSNRREKSKLEPCMNIWGDQEERIQPFLPLLQVKGWIKQMISVCVYYCCACFCLFCWLCEWVKFFQVLSGIHPFLLTWIPRNPFEVTW